MRKIITLGIFFSILLFGFGWLVQSYAENRNQTEIGKTYEIDFNELNSKLYVWADTWGISSNHSEIVISTTPIIGYRNYVKDECFIFYTYEIFYKIINVDSLLIYSDSNIFEPEDFNSPVYLDIHKIKTAKERVDIRTNYTKYGFKKISTY